MSKWLLLQLSSFTAISWREQYDDDEVRFVLTQHAFLPVDNMLVQIMADKKKMYHHWYFSKIHVENKFNLHNVYIVPCTIFIIQYKYVFFNSATVVQDKPTFWTMIQSVAISAAPPSTPAGGGQQTTTTTAGAGQESTPRSSAAFTMSSFLGIFGAVAIAVLIL